MRIVLDTNILISALGWRNGNERKILEMVLRDEIDLFISPDIIEEFLSVSGRKKFPFLKEDIEEFMGILIESASVVLPEERIHIVEEDPKDDMVLECAKQADADCIVTGDRHLLDLDDFNGIPIMNTAEFLKLYEIKKGSEEKTEK